MQTALAKKQIPTLLGIGVLVVGIVVGILFMNTNLGETFLPRAAPSAIPKSVRITNVKDTSFTISFITDDATVGFLKYGSEAGKLDLQASDDRDQSSGTVGQFTTHHITIRDLQPNTAYYYTLGTSARGAFDDNGKPFMITTAKNGGVAPQTKTAYGTVLSSTGTPVEGALVYLKHPNAGEQSNISKSSGSFAIPLSQARTVDGSSFATMNPDDDLQVFVQGLTGNDTATLTIKVADAQPIKTISLGQGDQGQADAEAATPSASPALQALSVVSPSPFASDAAIVADQNPGLAELATASAAPTQTLVDLTSATPQVVDTAQPVISGEAPPGVQLSIQIHSETQIQTNLTTDAQGNYTVDIAQLQQTLEPGEHTITVSYVDPKTGKTVTETKTFTVQPKLALATGTTVTRSATTSAKPFGSGNPFTITSPSPSFSPISTSSAFEPRTSMPATGSNLPTAGSVSTTLALIFGGLFLIVAGTASYFSAKQVETEEDG